MLKKVYCYLSYIIFPFVALILAKRRIKGKESIERFPERLGLNSYTPSSKKLLWFHGASVGEAVSMLVLINKILIENKDIEIMVTTGTLTSARLMEERLPKGAFHQFVPVDIPHYIRRFLNHFKPSAIFWFESEFWPNLVFEIEKKNIPLVLVNGRISNKSFKKWQWFKFFIKEILSCFSLCLGQTEEDTRRLGVLGAKNTLYLGNIKYASPKLPFNAKDLKSLQKAIGNRPLWLGASTHNPEELALAKTHIDLKKDFDNILTIIAPRHPNRGDDIVKGLSSLGLNIKQRSKSEMPDSTTDVYIADTLGELGLFYELCNKVFVGGSLIPHGGQNMLEPARFGCSVIVGKHTHNFTDMITRAKDKEAVLEVSDETELYELLKKLLSEPNLLEKYGKNAQEFAESEADVVNKIVDNINSFL
ncbi:MAG: 3-deoxy-D-manno-octulosonic acid transferase [Alphaproteobacteria bacterium]